MRQEFRYFDYYGGCIGVEDFENIALINHIMGALEKIFKKLY